MLQSSPQQQNPRPSSTHHGSHRQGTSASPTDQRGGHHLDACVAPRRSVHNHSVDTQVKEREPVRGIGGCWLRNHTRELSRSLLSEISLTINPPPPPPPPPFSLVIAFDSGTTDQRTSRRRPRVERRPRSGRTQSATHCPAPLDRRKYPWRNCSCCTFRRSAQSGRKKGRTGEGGVSRTKRIWSTPRHRKKKKKKKKTRRTIGGGAPRAST